VKDPEQVRRIELMARVETALRIAHEAINLAPVQYSVPKDHPLAEAVEETKIALARAQVLAAQVLRVFQR
jgi:hypothetical protein